VIQSVNGKSAQAVTLSASDVGAVPQGGAMTGGSINGTPIGQTTPAAVSGTSFKGPMNALAESDPSQNLYVTHEGYQAAWQGRQFTVRTAPAGRSSFAYAADASMLLDPGAGINGPARAGYGRIIGVVKQGYPNSPAFGEIDSVLVTARISGPTATSTTNASDCNGIQGNVQMSGDCGFISFGEFQTTRIDPTSYAITHSIRIQIGAIDPFGKNGEQGLGAYSKVNTLSFGYGAIADTGALDRGLYVTQVGGGTFDDGIHVAAGPGTPTFRVKMNGDIHLGPDPTKMIIAAGSNVLTFKNATQGPVAYVYNDGTISSIGTISAAILKASGFQVAGANGHIFFRQYTRQTLPTATPSNTGYAQVNNPEPNKTVLVFNGGNGYWQYLDGSPVSQS
jgi:hypothetical protein